MVLDGEDISWYVRFGHPSTDLPISGGVGVAASPYDKIREETFIRAAQMVTSGDSGRYAGLLNETVLGELGSLRGNIMFFRKPDTINTKTEVAADEDFSSEVETFVAVVGMWRRTGMSTGAAASRMSGHYFLPVAQVEVIIPRHKADEIEDEAGSIAGGSRRGSVLGGHGGGAVLAAVGVDVAAAPEEEGHLDDRILAAHERLGGLLRRRMSDGGAEESV